MNYSYMEWKKHLMDEDVHAMAILSFPAVTKCAITVQELVQNAELQSAVMRRIKEEFPLQEALVSMMDLSVEAEAFGCNVRFSEDEVPTVIGQLVADERIERMVKHCVFRKWKKGACLYIWQVWRISQRKATVLYSAVSAGPIHLQED